MNDFTTRLIPGILYALIILGCLMFNSFSFLTLMLVFCIVIVIEYGKVIRKEYQDLQFISDSTKKNEKVKYGKVFLRTEFPILTCFFILLSFGIHSILNNYESSIWYELIILLFCLINSSILIYLVLNNKPLFNSNETKTWPLLGVTFSFLLIIYASLLYDYSNFKFFFLFYLLLIWGVDTFGYIIGIKFGKNKLFESLSPKKSIEGAVGALIFSVTYSILISFYLNISIIFCLATCLLICVLAIIGDLVQSKIKRELKIKDFGKWLPGHGGLYDRMDSLIFTFPFLYLIVKILLYVS